MRGKSKKVDAKRRKSVELAEMNIFIRIPKEAVALAVTASLLDEDGKVMKVSKKLTVSEIQQQRQDFLDNVEDGDDYDGKFVITEEGMRCLEELAAQAGQEAQDVLEALEGGDD